MFKAHLPLHYESKKVQEWRRKKKSLKNVKRVPKCKKGKKKRKEKKKQSYEVKNFHPRHF